MMDSNEATTLPVPYAHDAVLDLHLGAAVVQLPDRDDGVLQPRNVAHSGECLVLPVPPNEDHGVAATNFHDGAIAETQSPTTE